MSARQLPSPTAHVTGRSLRRLVAAMLVVAPALAAQQTGDLPSRPDDISLAGPRFGITVLTGSLVDTARARADVGRVFTQFGWQFEQVFYSVENGPRAVNELVVLLGGLDQNTVIPSASWLVGLRMRNGAEFGVGPNVTPAGVALAMATGVTVRAGYLNIPVNLAMVPSKYGWRFSLLSGFTFRR